jgi:7-cyano-7-deazaguanine synthase in queuosine biosynthesis
MTYKIITSQDTIEFNLKGYTGVAICLSGGADSSTLFYCLAEYLTVEKLDVKLYPITISSKHDLVAIHAATLVVNFVRKRFPNVFIDHICESINLGGDWKALVADRIIEKMYFNGEIQAYIEGVTRNPDSTFKFVPPPTHHVPAEAFREVYIPKTKVSHGGLLRIRPFAGINKKGVCEVADQKGITARILLMTRSCTDSKEFRCNACWWCQERHWGFNIPAQYRNRI